MVMPKGVFNWYRCFYPHRSRELVSLVCGILKVQMGSRLKGAVWRWSDWGDGWTGASGQKLASAQKGERGCWGGIGENCGECHRQGLAEAFPM